MKLRLPHKFQAALMAALASVSITTLSSGTIAVATGAAILAGEQAQAYSRDITTDTTTAGDTTYNGYVFTMFNGSGNFSGRHFKHAVYNAETKQWENVGNEITSGNKDVDTGTPLGTGYFWTMYCSTSTVTNGIAYGNTLRLSGAIAQQKLSTDFSDFTIGGLIADDSFNDSFDTPAYWFYRGGSMDINGANDVNMDVDSHVRFSYRNSVNMRKGGTWTIHSGKTLTFDNDSSSYATTFYFFADQALTVKGGGTLNLGRTSNGTYSVTMQEGSSLHVTGTGTTVGIQANSGTFTANGAITVDEGSTLSIGLNTTLGRTITNAGTVTIGSGKTVTLSSNLSGFDYEAVFTDYEVSTGKGFAGSKTYTVINNTGSGSSNLASVSYGGQSYTLTNGKFTLAGDTDYTTYYIQADDATVDLDQAISYAQTQGGGATLGTVNVQGANATITVDSDQNLSNLVIASGKSVNTAGTGTLTLGALTNGGTLNIGASTTVATTGAITVDSGTSTITGQGTFDSSAKLTVDGGTVTLSAADVQFSAIDLGNGTLNISAGTTTVDGNVTLGYGNGKASGTLTVAQGATLTAQNVNSPWGFNSLTVDGTINATNQFSITTGAGVRNVTGSGIINTAHLVVGNQTTKAVFSGGLEINIGDGGITGSSGVRPLELHDVTVGVYGDSTGWSAENAITLGSADTGTTFDVGSGKTVTLGGVLSGSGKMNVTGGGTVTLNGANTFSGGLTVTGATVEMGNNNALGNANNAITIGQGGVIDLKGHDNVDYAYTLAGGTLQNTGNATGAGMKQTKGLTLTENSTIGGTGDFQIIASGHAATTINLGNETLAKTGDNTVHFVNSTITEGTVQVDAGALDFRTDHGSNTVKANIVLNGGGTALTGGFKYADSETAVSRALTANRDVTASAAMELGTNVTLAANVATGKTLTMSGALTGNGGLTKTGDGTLALTAAASYNGNTAVNGGTLALGSSLTTSGTVTVAADAGITFANGATISANSMTLETGSTLDFSAYKGSIGSQVNVVTTTAGVTGFDDATIVKPAISVQGLTTGVKQEGNNIVLTFTPEAEGTMHLYILTGQSNSLGSVKGNPAPADLFAQYASGGLLYNGNMHKGGSRYVADPDWKIVDVQPKGEGDASYAVTGPEYVFEYLMLKNGWFSDTPSKDSLGVIKASLDGGGDEYWVKDGANSNYGAILDTVTKGYQEAEAMGYANVTIDGLLYLQGESNSHGGTAVQTNYTTFLTNLKADLEAAGIDTNKILFGEHSVLGEPATWGQTDTSVGNEKNAGDTHTQLENLAKATEGIDFVYTRDLDKINPGDGMGVHYNGEAQITIGARYAYAFAVQNGKDVSYDLGGGKKGAVRGSNDQVALTEAGAWWDIAPDANTVAVWDVSSVSTPSSAVQLQGYGNYIADGATWTVGGIHVADAYKQLVTINGGTVSLGAGGISLVGGGLSMTSDVTVRESQTWQAEDGLSLAVNGTTTIDTGAKLTLADDLYLTFGYITGTGSLEIGTVTFDMDLDYMGTMGKASYISYKGPDENGYVNEVNLIDLTDGDGTITFTHGGGVNDITKRGGLADCTLTLGEDNKTLKVTMPSTAPKTVYFTRSGEVVYTADDDGENGIYNATELVLSGVQDSPATLTLSTALKSGVGIKAEGLGGTVKIDSNVVLNASSLETDGAPVTIAGSGEYVGNTLGAVGSVTAADVLGQGVTLASDWTGSVVLSGGNSSFSGYTSMGNLADFYKTGSTIVFNGLYGYFDDSHSIGANIEFRGTGEDGTGAALTYTAGNNKTVELSGTVTGQGDFVFDKNGGNPDAIKFTGDIAGWNGTITTGNHNSATLNLTFGGAVTDVNVAITKGQNHPINVTVDATSAVSFNKALTNLNSLTLNANKSASVLGGISTNDTTLNAGASLTIGGTDTTTNSLGTVTVNGTGSSLTINQAATITGMTLSTNAGTTVTNNVAGTNLGNVTLNNNTALTIAGTEAVAAGNVKVGNQCAATITLGNDFSMDQLDTIGANKTLSIASEQGMTKTLTTGALGFDNVNTVISLQNVNMVVTGAATAGVIDVTHTNNKGTMTVGTGATLALQGTVQWNTGDTKYVDLVISNGGAVSVTGGTGNTLRGVNLGAGSSLTFAEGTSTTIGGAVVLANTITNDGSVTLTGTVNLDALTALHEDEGYWEGEEDTGNGFYYNSSTVRVFAVDHVGEVVSTSATITYKGVGGTLDDETGIFEANGEKDLTTFHAMKDGSWSSLGNAITKGETHLTTVKMHAGTGLTADVTTAVENLSIDADSATKAAHVAGGTANFTNLLGEGKVDVDSEAVLNATNITVESGKSLAIGGAGALGITNINGAGTVNVNAAAVTGGNVAINGGGTVNFGDGETISFTGLNVSDNGTNVTFDSLVTVTGNKRPSIGYEAPATEGTTVTFNAGYAYTGNDGYALLAGNNDTIKLGGTTNLSNKTVGLNITGKLVVLEDAVVAVGRMYNSSTDTSNGTVEVQQRGTLTIGSVGDSTITNLSNAGKVTVNRTTTVVSAFSNTGSISVVGTSASSMTTLNVNNNGETLDMGAISLNNAELHFGSGAESRVRNITALTVDGTAKLTQKNWNNLMHIGALNNGAGEGDRSFTWQMDTNHYTNSVLYLDGEGNFNGTFTASRGNAGGNGAYQGHLQINHQKALQNAVLEVNGYNASNYMSVALNADTVETAGVKGKANSIIYAGEANTDVNKGAGRTAPTSTKDATLAMDVASNETYDYKGKVESRISLEKSGAGTQTFSGNMQSFNGSVEVKAGTLNIMNIAQATSLNVKDVTIAANATMGVYNGTSATAETASEGTLTMKAGNTLKAGGANATLNANLVMEAGSTLEVSLAQATHGLTMGSTVGLNTGDLLGEASLAAVKNLAFGEYFYLANSVDTFSVNGTQYDHLYFQDWTNFDMDASVVYNTQLAEKRYALVYSWNGSNVGTIAITLIPEPTTGTLSLLALAALAARRRRKG